MNSIKENNCSSGWVQTLHINQSSPKLLFTPLHTIQQYGTTSCSLHTIPGPLWWLSLCVECTALSTATCFILTHLLKSCSGWFTMQSLFPPIRSGSSCCWKPLVPFVCLSKLSYLSYGIKHFPPSTLMSCACYTRLNYSGEETMFCLFSTKEPTTILGT